jgi:hypothetical protein
VAQTTKSFQETIKELWELLKAYAAQETVDPLRTLGRRVGFGIGGSLLFSFGWFLITLGIMRLLQTHSLPLVHEWFMVHDWAVYGVALVILGIGMFGALRKIRRPEADQSAPARIERTV